MRDCEPISAVSGCVGGLRLGREVGAGSGGLSGGDPGATGPHLARTRPGRLRRWAPMTCVNTFETRPKAGNAQNVAWSGCLTEVRNQNKKQSK